MIRYYEVWGEYGPLAYQDISFHYRAHSKESALKRGIKDLKKMDSWKRIGIRNVHVHEITQGEYSPEP